MADRDIDDNDRGVPLSTRACAFVGLIMAVTITLYGYMRGFSISFAGIFIIIVCAVILLKGTKQQRRGRRSTFREGPLHFIESETQLATHSPVAIEQYTFEENGENRENHDAQASLLHQYENERGTGSASTWIWGRPPSYCFDDKRDANAISPPSYQDTMKSSSCDRETPSPFQYEEGPSHNSFSITAPNEEGRVEELMTYDEMIVFDTSNQEWPSQNTPSPLP